MGLGTKNRQNQTAELCREHRKAKLANKGSKTDDQGNPEEAAPAAES